MTPPGLSNSEATTDSSEGASLTETPRQPVTSLEAAHPGRYEDARYQLAADDAGLPADPEFRAALRAYMEWAVADVLTFSAVGSSVPAGLPMPRWSWDGLQNPIAR